MKKILKRLAIGVAVFLVLGTSAVAIAVVARENRTFDAPYPELRASKDPAVIERGRYLVTGPAHCTECHGAVGDHAAERHLVGGLAFEVPIGTVYARNITPDVATGIGRYTDPEIARVLRYGVHPSGRAVLPFMPFTDMTDEDLTAVISYLRSRPAIDHHVPSNDFNLLGRAAKAFLLEPTGPKHPVRARVTPGPTAEYGEYLATTVANCNGCHTRRSLRTGAPEGVAFAGGMTVESHEATPKKFITPNLTPDPETGHIYAWSEDAFVARFKAGVATGSPMPWQAFARMTDDDLRALYRYLRSLPPARLGQEL
ncbi:MAG: c-type cytochrome [Kofleriaceae bacterium]|nr:MAG: c-type cytochrome [Kofleriaceae bacterium]MBZ0233381.1 c-type cytochrome [Kofleriaceae bacterium]